MYATLFKPRILVPSFPKLDMHSSIQISKYPENLTLIQEADTPAEQNIGAKICNRKNTLEANLHYPFWTPDDLPRNPGEPPGGPSPTVPI